MSDTETKLAAARTRLILDKPFLGALVLRLPLKAGDPAWCKTTATDAKTLYYNESYIRHLTLNQTQFVLAHEALHCALSHFARRAHRDKHRWDVACDFAINPLLIADGLSPTPEALYLKEYEGMTAEEIYPLIEENPEQEPMDQHLYDESDSDAGAGNQATPRREPPPKEDNQDKNDEGQGTSPEQDEGAQGEAENNQGEANEEEDGRAPPPLTESERAELAVAWQQRLAGAAQQAMQAGKLGGAMARLVDHLLQPQLPWRMLLARYMTQVARDDYNYMRPSSRREGPAIYPSLKSAECNITIALDTSGSISESEISEFIAEINAIKGQMRARVKLLACDAALADNCPWTFESWEALDIPKDLAGGGGTDFRPVFEWAAKEDRAPELLVYFTDAEGSFPEIEPAFPVLWLVKGRHEIPWGQRVQLN